MSGLREADRRVVHHDRRLLDSGVPIGDCSFHISHGLEQGRRSGASEYRIDREGHIDDTKAFGLLDDGIDQIGPIRGVQLVLTGVQHVRGRVDARHRSAELV